MITIETKVSRNDMKLVYGSMKQQNHKKEPNQILTKSLLILYFSTDKQEYIMFRQRYIKFVISQNGKVK